MPNSFRHFGAPLFIQSAQSLGEGQFLLQDILRYIGTHLSFASYNVQSLQAAQSHRQHAHPLSGHPLPCRRVRNRAARWIHREGYLAALVSIVNLSRLTAPYHSIRGYWDGNVSSEYGPTFRPGSMNETPGILSPSVLKGVKASSLCKSRLAYCCLVRERSNVTDTFRGRPPSCRTRIK